MTVYMSRSIDPEDQRSWRGAVDIRLVGEFVGAGSTSYRDTVCGQRR